MSGELLRRIDAAIFDTGVSRAAVELDWPECHRKKCPGFHPSPDLAFTTMKIRIAESVRKELLYHSTTRPDITEEGDTPHDAATYTLAALLNRYNVHDAGTFVKAALLILEAYPAIIPALSDSQTGENHG